MVTKNDNIIVVGCDCGCSALLIKYSFGNIWFDKMESSFYVSQLNIKNIISERFKRLKLYLTRKEVYIADIILSREDFFDTIKYLNEFKKEIEDGKYGMEEGEESFLPSHIHAVYMPDVKEFAITIKAKYKFKDIITGRICQYYEPYMNLEDFSKFVDKITKFSEKYKTEGVK